MSELIFWNVEIFSIALERLEVLKITAKIEVVLDIYRYMHPNDYFLRSNKSRHIILYSQVLPNIGTHERSRCGVTVEKKICAWTCFFFLYLFFVLFFIDLIPDFSFFSFFLASSFRPFSCAFCVLIILATRLWCVQESITKLLR